MYYHPGLLASDEVSLRNAFFKANEMHDTYQSVAQVGWFSAYWPSLYYISRTVKPLGCAVFTGAWAYAYFKGISPALKANMQRTLNNTAEEYRAKYDIKKDEDYMK